MLSDILLELSEGPLRLYHIAERANLAFGRTKELVSRLLELQLISLDDRDRSYNLTSRGRLALDHYVSLLHLLGKQQREPVTAP